ncbi:MAG TPA: FRG domain-containing protein [Anaerolineaceae bacterium]|nr:FRG domain-containing protein [Anaerolineaceae bacterium]
MNETRISNWNELQEALYANAWRADIKRFRSPYVYRGLSDAAYRLETSLMRLGGNYAQMEQHLLRNFRKYAHRDIVERDTLWHWLSLAQHHGLPTRLLDWTVSPLVAAHFATANTDKYNRDGAIWAIDYRKAHEMLPDRFKAALAEEGAEFFTVELLARLVESLDDLDRIQPEPFQLFFEPPSIDDRIVNQFALFSVMSDPTASLSAWLEDRPGLWCKIVIPAGLKWEIRDRLDQANLTERVLFPGLDGLSRWQKRYYTPRE